MKSRLMKIHHLLSSRFAFFHALASAGELESADQFCQLARKTFARTVRSERQFKTQSGYFGYCKISLNAEKVIILPTFFCKSGGSTQLCCYLAICVKIARFISVFLVVIFCRLRFQSLKSNKNSFSIFNM